MNEIRTLTSLRGVAAMAVVMQHFSTTAETLSSQPIPSLVPHGYLAVDLFFVLSGFIMAYTYGADFAIGGRAAMAPFLLKRAARLLPLNTACVLAIVVAGMISTAIAEHNIFYASKQIVYDVLCNLLLLQGLGIGQNLNGPSWSISTECVAYLLFPVLLSATSRPSRVATGILVSICSGAVAWIASMHRRMGLDVDSCTYELVICLSQFMLGLFTHRLTLAIWAKPWLKSDKVASGVIAWVALFSCLRLDLLTVAAFPLVVATLACNRGRIASLLSHRAFYNLGEISFSIYLIHDPCRPLAAAMLQTIYPARLSPVMALGFAFICSFLVIPLAWFAYRTVECPGRRAIRRLTRRLPAGDAELASPAALLAQHAGPPGLGG